MIELRPEPWTPELIAEVAAAFEGHDKSDTSGGLVGAVEGIEQGAFCRVLADGEPVAFYVLFVRAHSGGLEAEISHAWGRAGFDITQQVLPLIERQCSQAEAVTIKTRRAGLIQKLKRQGYAVESVTLRKRSHA